MDTDAELGRKPNIKLPTGGKNPKLLIVHACEMLENRMKQDLMEGHITPSPELRKRLETSRREKDNKTSREQVEVLPPGEIIPAGERASLATSAPAHACNVVRAGTRRMS